MKVKYQIEIEIAEVEFYLQTLEDIIRVLYEKYEELGLEIKNINITPNL